MGLGDQELIVSDDDEKDFDGWSVFNEENPLKDDGIGWVPHGPQVKDISSIKEAPVSSRGAVKSVALVVEFESGPPIRLVMRSTEMSELFIATDMRSGILTRPNPEAADQEQFKSSGELDVKIEIFRRPR